MRFPPEFLDRLRGHFLISEVIGKRIPIKRHGREFMACCPFHKEKTPSFTINDDKGFYHCFGCGAHGDTIGFVKDFENISYVEAIERLAGEANMPLPQVSREEQERLHQAKSLHDVMEAACQWFAVQLETPAALPVRDYLGQRGIERDMIAQFRIGFAPANRDALRTHLIGKGFEEKQLIEAGLLIPSDRGMPFARFTERLMFPINDRQGKVIAFGGRILPNASATSGMASAKYVNSPETPLFHKGHVLYNFSTARRAAKDSGTIVVAEGYMDVIALAQAGVNQAVAPLGTAMTEEHLRQLWQTVAEPVLCLDGDTAGQRAMWRAAELALPLLQAGHGLKFALLPDGHDPDSLLRAQGADAVQAALRAAIPLSEAMWNHFVQQHPEPSPESRARLEKALMLETGKIADESVKRHFRQYLMDQLRALSRPAPAQQQSRSGYSANQTKPNGRNFKAAISSVVSSAVRSTALGNAQTMAEQGANAQMLYLLALAPQLLDLPEVEDDLHRIPELEHDAKGWLSPLHGIMHGEGLAAREALEQLPEPIKKQWEESCKLARRHIHKRLQVAAEENASELLRQGWRFCMRSWEWQQLQQEHSKLTRQPVEEAYPQLLALQKQLQQLQRERQLIQEYLDSA